MLRWFFKKSMKATIFACLSWQHRSYRSRQNLKPDWRETASDRVQGSKQSVLPNVVLQSLAGTLDLNWGLPKQDCLMTCWHSTAHQSRKGNSFINLFFFFPCRLIGERQTQNQNICGGKRTALFGLTRQNSLFQFNEGFENKQSIPRRNVSNCPVLKWTHWIILPTPV